jgi:predicted benzoate:H+ symporter BenE
MRWPGVSCAEAAGQPFSKPPFMAMMQPEERLAVNEERYARTDFRLDLREINGALGDLGSLLPLMLAAIAVAGLAPVPVVTGFAVFYIVTAFVYRLPIPVQPMKAVIAVLITAELAPTELAASGVMIGAVLLVLGLTGWITHLARLAPQSVLAGLQLGLGLMLAIVSLELLSSAPIVGLATLAVLLVLLLRPGLPSVAIALVVGIAMARYFGGDGIDIGSPTAVLAMPAWPTVPEIERAASLLVLPQLSLTLTNAVLITALLAGDYYGKRAAHVTPARLSVTTGLANLVLPPFGALPMCHGAGGLAAHHRFGARTGTAPLALGLALVALVFLPWNWAAAMLTAIPIAALGALLLMASAELALTRRLFDSKPSCWPVIAVTAGVTVWLDPFLGLVAGSLAELARLGLVRLVFRQASR